MVMDEATASVDTQVRCPGAGEGRSAQPGEAGGGGASRGECSFRTAVKATASRGWGATAVLRRWISMRRRVSASTVPCFSSRGRRGGGAERTPAEGDPEKPQTCGLVLERRFPR